MAEKNCPVRVAVVGLGTFGEMHLRAFSQLQREGQAELVAICDVDEELLGRRAETYGGKPYTDYRQLIPREDLDAVSVVTPDFLHREIVLYALDFGCHVLVEKPLDVTVEGCDQIVAAAEKAQRLVQVDFHKRYDPYHQRLARTIAEGRLGQVLYGYAWMEDRVEVPRDWFPRWAPQSSPFWFLGVHMVDLVRFCIRADATRVFATGRKGKLSALGVDTYDCVNAKITFENGATFAVDTSWVLPEGFEAVVNQGIRVVGTEGLVEVDSQNRGAEACIGADGQQTWNEGFFHEETDPDGKPRWSGYGVEAIADFVRNVALLRSGVGLGELRGCFADARDAREVTRIACAAHRSLETGEVVDL